MAEYEICYKADMGTKRENVQADKFDCKPGGEFILFYSLPDCGVSYMASASDVLSVRKIPEN